MRSSTARIPKRVMSSVLLYVVMGLFGAAPTTMISAQASGWHITATLVPKGWTAATGPDPYLGWSLAMDGDTLVAGAPSKNNYVGVAEVFVRSGTTWTWQAELAPKDGKSGDGFGWAVAIQGNTILVGSPHKDNFAGGAYLFQRTGKTWAPKDFPLPDGIKPGDLFGWSIASVALAGPAATPAATAQAKVVTDRVNAGGVSPRSLAFQLSEGNLFAIGAPGANNLEGEVMFTFVDDYGTISQSKGKTIVNTITGQIANAAFGSLAHMGRRATENRDITVLSLIALAPGYTLGSPPKIANKYASGTLDANGVPTAPITSHDIPLDPTTTHFGATLPIPVDAPAAASGPSWLLLEAPVNNSGVVSGLNLFGLSDDGTVTTLDNEPATIGGVVYGYAGATNGTDVVLLGADAKKAGSLGFYTLQANKLVASAQLPFGADPFQLQNTGGPSSFLFSADGKTLVAATLDPKTHSEAIAILGKN